MMISSVATIVILPRTVPLITTLPSTKITPLKFGFNSRVMGNRYLRHQLLHVSQLPRDSRPRGQGNHLPPRVSFATNPPHSESAPPR